MTSIGSLQLRPPSVEVETTLRTGTWAKGASAGWIRKPA